MPLNGSARPFVSACTDICLNRSRRLPPCALACSSHDDTHTSARPTVNAIRGRELIHLMSRRIIHAAAQLRTFNAWSGSCIERTRMKWQGRTGSTNVEDRRGLRRYANGRRRRHWRHRSAPPLLGADRPEPDRPGWRRDSRRRGPRVQRACRRSADSVHLGRAAGYRGSLGTDLQRAQRALRTAGAGPVQRRDAIGVRSRSVGHGSVLLSRAIRRSTSICRSSRSSTSASVRPANSHGPTSSRTRSGITFRR